MILGGGLRVPVEHPDPLAFRSWLRSEALAAGFARAGFAGGGMGAAGVARGAVGFDAAVA